MVERSFTRNYITTLTMPFLCLEIFADELLPDARIVPLSGLIETAWPAFLRIIDEEQVYAAIPLQLKGKVLEVELAWTTNETMQSLNLEYRRKDSPTDGLTFTMLADAPDPQLWLSMPVLQLGSIFISLDYAKQALEETPGQPLEHYLLERFVHGMLHLFGMHHETMEKFEKVVHIQKRVLAATFPETDAPELP